MRAILKFNTRSQQRSEILVNARLLRDESFDPSSHSQSLILDKKAKKVQIYAKYLLEEKIEQSRSKVWRRKKIPKFEVLSASCNQVNKYLLHYFFLLSRPFISILSYRQFGENELQLTVPKK